MPWYCFQGTFLSAPLAAATRSHWFMYQAHIIQMPKFKGLSLELNPALDLCGVGVYS